MAVASIAQRALPWLVLLGAGALVFGRVLGFGFTFYDDAPLLVDHHAEVRSLRAAFASFFGDAFAVLGPASRGVFYRPILWASYLPDARIGGIRPGVYHATNLLLHLAACGLVYTLLRRLGHAVALALGLALVLCLHPALVSVVAWIPCRNESLLAIFAVLAVLALLRFLERPGAARGALVLLALALALFTKESGVGLLIVLPALAWVERRRAEGVRARLVALGACAGGVTLGWLLLRRVALGGVRVAFAPREQLPTAIGYVGKTFVPVQLSVVPSVADTSMLPGLAGVALLAGLAFALRRRLLGRAGLGLLWYAVFLAPALFVASDTQGLEHRIYVPLIGLLICIAELPAVLTGVARRRFAVALAVVLCAAAWTSFRRLPQFADDTSFWESAVRSSPSSELVWRMRAWRQFEQGRPLDAEQSALRGIALRPREARSHLMLGIALARQGRLVDAEPALRRAVELDPDNGDAWHNLAMLEKLTGRPEDGARSMRRADEARAPRPPR